MLLQTMLHDFLNNVVANQLPGIHNTTDTRFKPSVILNVPDKNITDTDMDQVEFFPEQMGLSSLAAPLHSHNHLLLYRSLLHRSTSLEIQPGLATVRSWLMLNRFGSDNPVVWRQRKSS